MTLDDAIVEYTQTANIYKHKIDCLDKYKDYLVDNRDYLVKKREEYMQLALWLKELRVRRNSSCSCYDDYNIKKEIDDNVGKIWESGNTAYGIMENDSNIFFYIE